MRNLHIYEDVKPITIPFDDHNVRVEESCRIHKAACLGMVKPRILVRIRADVRKPTASGIGATTWLCEMSSIADGRFVTLVRQVRHDFCKGTRRDSGQGHVLVGSSGLAPGRLVVNPWPVACSHRTLDRAARGGGSSDSSNSQHRLSFFLLIPIPTTVCSVWH